MTPGVPICSEFELCLLGWQRRSSQSIWPSVSLHVQLTYLGRVVGQGQVAPVHAKVLAVAQFPQPVTKKELMRFLGMVGYYRCFSKNFSTVDGLS